MRLRALGRDEAGSTALEFALVAPVVIMLILSILEIGVMAFQAASLDNAVTMAARTIRTGQADGPATAGAFRDMMCGMMVADLATCRSKMAISVQPYANFTDVAAAAAVVPAGQFNRGTASQIMLVKATYRWPLMTPFMGRLFTQDNSEVVLNAQAAFKNEPYS